MLDKLDSRILWTDAARTKYYLISDDERLLPGSFVLRTLTGRELRVDPASLEQFELSEEQAKEWLKAEFGKMLDETRGAIDGFIKRLNEAAGKTDDAASKSHHS